ncbi:MAG: PilZ domain-containing protein [Gammaproteobacteria bacterium]|jgi:type IV pilus assembly protein PilZ
MSTGSSGKKMLNVRYSTVEQLHQGYISFIENGGLFVQTTDNYSLGEELFMLITLPEDDERYPASGRIAWITPRAAVGHWVPGIGVQLSDQDKGRLRNRIEGLLEGLLDSDTPTFTM